MWFTFWVFAGREGEVDNDDELVGTCVDIQEGDTVCVAGMQTVEDTCALI